MKFSIITICKNDKNRLMDTIKSIRSQTFNDYEHIIQDGLSSDGTDRVVEEYIEDSASSVKFFTEKDNGIYDAMNLAIDKAEGDYIIFMNAGDYFLSDNTLSEVNKEIEKNPFSDIYYGNAIVIHPDKSEAYQEISIDEEKLVSKYTLESGSLCLIHQAMFAKREIMNVHQFNCGYKLRAELDWYYKCIDNQLTFLRMPFPVCLYTLGGMSESIVMADTNISETKEIIESYGYDSEKYLDRLSKSHFSKGIYKYIYNQWLALDISKKYLYDYLKSQGIHTVAIFGYGELGCKIYNTLKDSTVQVAYFIESRENYPYSGIPVFKPSDDNSMTYVDIIIVTAIIHYNEILEQYSHIYKSPMISFEKVLDDMWTWNNGE